MSEENTLFHIFFSCGLQPIGSTRANKLGLGIMSKKNTESLGQHVQKISLYVEFEAAFPKQ